MPHSPLLMHHIAYNICAYVVACPLLQQCAAVRLVVYDSVCDRVRLCDSAAECGSAAVCGNAAVSGSATVRVWQCGNVRQCGNVWHYARLCAVVRAAVRTAMCGSVWHCVAARAALCGSALYDIYVHKVAHNVLCIGMPLYKGAVGLSPVFLAYKF
jgi:hypothetical protein